MAKSNYDKVLTETARAISGTQLNEMFGRPLTDKELTRAIEIGQEITRYRDYLSIITDGEVLDEIIEVGNFDVTRNELKDEIGDWIIERVRKIKRMRI